MGTGRPAAQLRDRLTRAPASHAATRSAAETYNAPTLRHVKSLSYQPPLAWEAALAFLAARRAGRSISARIRRRSPCTSRRAGSISARRSAASGCLARPTLRARGPRHPRPTGDRERRVHADVEIHRGVRLAHRHGVAGFHASRRDGGSRGRRDACEDRIARDATRARDDDPSGGRGRGERCDAHRSASGRRRADAPTSRAAGHRATGLAQRAQSPQRSGSTKHRTQPFSGWSCH